MSNHREISSPTPASLKTARLRAPELHDEDFAIQSRVDDAYRLIISAIFRGDLPGGSELKSTELAEALGVSRTPIVRALSRLIADDIITQEMNMRAIVRPGAENWLAEIRELQFLLEPAAAARAAQLMPNGVIDELFSQADAVAPHSDEDWPKHVREFEFSLHMAIADHAANQPLRGAITKCWQYKGFAYAQTPSRIDLILRGYQEHLLILAAIRARDSATASAAMELHLRLASFYRPPGQAV